MEGNEVLRSMIARWLITRQSILCYNKLLGVSFIDGIMMGEGERVYCAFFVLGEVIQFLLYDLSPKEQF